MSTIYEMQRSNRRSSAHSLDQVEELLDLFPEAVHLSGRLRRKEDLESLFQDTLDFLSEILGGSNNVVKEFLARKTRRKSEEEKAARRAVRKSTGVRFADDEARAFAYLESQELQKAGIVQESLAMASTPMEKVHTLSKGLLASTVEGQEWIRAEARSPQSTLRGRAPAEELERREDPQQYHFEEPPKTTSRMRRISRRRAQGAESPTISTQETDATAFLKTKFGADATISAYDPRAYELYQQALHMPRRMTYDQVGTVAEQATFRDPVDIPVYDVNDDDSDAEEEDTYYFLSGRSLLSKQASPTTTRLKMKSSLSKSPRYQRQRQPIHIDDSSSNEISERKSSESGTNNRRSYGCSWLQKSNKHTQRQPLSTGPELVRNVSNASVPHFIETTRGKPSKTLAKDPPIVDISVSSSSCSFDENQTSHRSRDKATNISRRISSLQNQLSAAAGSKKTDLSIQSMMSNFEAPSLAAANPVGGSYSVAATEPSMEATSVQSLSDVKPAMFEPTTASLMSTSKGPNIGIPLYTADKSGLNGSLASLRRHKPLMDASTASSFGMPTLSISSKSLEMEERVGRVNVSPRGPQRLSSHSDVAITPDSPREEDDRSIADTVSLHSFETLIHSIKESTKVVDKETIVRGMRMDPPASETFVTVAKDPDEHASASLQYSVDSNQKTETTSATSHNREKSSRSRKNRETLGLNLSRNGPESTKPQKRFPPKAECWRPKNFWNSTSYSKRRTCTTTPNTCTPTRKESLFRGREVVESLRLTSEPSPTASKRSIDINGNLVNNTYVQRHHNKSIKNESLSFDLGCHSQFSTSKSKEQLSHYPFLDLNTPTSKKSNQSSQNLADNKSNNPQRNESKSFEAISPKSILKTQQQTPDSQALKDRKNQLPCDLRGSLIHAGDLRKSESMVSSLKFQTLSFDDSRASVSTMSGSHKPRCVEREEHARVKANETLKGTHIIIRKQRKEIRDYDENKVLRVASTGETVPSRKEQLLMTNPTEKTNTTTGVVCSHAVTEISTQPSTGDSSDTSSLSSKSVKKKRTKQHSHPGTKREKLRYYKARGNGDYKKYQPENPRGPRSVGSYSTWATADQQLLLNMQPEADYVRYFPSDEISGISSNGSDSTGIDEVIERCQRKLEDHRAARRRR